MGGETPLNIHGDAAIGYHTFKKKVSRIKGVEELSLSDLRDRRKSEQPSLSVYSGNSVSVEKLTKVNRRIATDNSAKLLVIRPGSAANTVGELSRSILDPSTVFRVNR